MITRLVPLVALLALLCACADTTTTTLQRPGAPAKVAVQTTTPTPPPAPSTSVPSSPARVHANELGLVPVLMYHRIVAAPKSVYDRTPADFRAELERLAKERYVPITAAEFTASDIDIPAGTHPVVLTFDDGDRSQLALSPTGTPSATSAVGILLAVARAHPGFRAVATFYVNNKPFGDPGGRRTLPWLHAHGFDIGNHTLDHTDLRTATAATVRSEIVRCDQEIRRAAPDAAPTTLALPYGLHPKQQTLALRGQGYSYRGVLLVGANPSPSPFALTFDPLNIPRIRSEGPTGPDAQFGSSAWLNKLAADPASRYTSDGDPSRVSFRSGGSQQVSARYAAAARQY
ncbi:MAG TPA: polysaccharide deacetylase family protein [Pseudonocardiaceae bacterium]